MEPVTFYGEAFSEYFCTKLLWTDPQLGSQIDQQAADELYKKASATIRFAQRELKDREHARSTYTLLLARLGELLGWRLGQTSKVVTELELEEEAGAPLLDADDRTIARALCIAPDAHLDAAPAGLHRRFAPTQSLARVLKEEKLDYGIAANAYELRLVCTVGTLPSHIAFDLTAIAEGGAAGLVAWKLMHALLNQSAISAKPPLLDQVRKIGSQHQQSVSTTLGRQVQQAVVRFMQGVLDHPDNRGKLPETITDQFLHDLYQESLRYLYRLLFALYAEDLHLLPMDVRTYQEGYSLNRLIQLARQPGQDALEVTDPTGQFFQYSLEALFALLRTGCHLGTEGEIKAYGGRLFDRGGTPLLNDLVLGNAMLDNVIEKLTVINTSKGQIKLSYRELNVEQLGSIYEGLLEQTPAFAHERVWRCELDSRIIVIDDASRERIRTIRGEKLTVEELALEEEDSELEDEQETEDEGDDGDESDEVDGEENDDTDEEEQPKPKKSAKKPLKVLGEIARYSVYLKSSQARKQSGSYYTNRAFVEFLVREALDPMAVDKKPSEILSLKVLDPAMGSAHFLVGATRRLGEHLLSAYRREIVRLRAENPEPEVSETDLLVLAGVPDELIQVWDSADEERELAVCRLIVAGNCIYGVDLNPLAVDLAKVSLWLVTAASQFPLTFIDHRLQCGNSLLGIPADEVVRPWIRPTPKNKRNSKPKAVKPVELLISPRRDQEAFEFDAPSHKALCQSFKRALVCLRDLNHSVEQEPTDFQLHQAKHQALRGTLQPWWQTHELRVGAALSDSEVNPDILNNWLSDLVEHGKVSEEHGCAAKLHRERGRSAGAFCWELAFPEVFFDEDGSRRPDAGFSCVLGNPPWDKIKPERDGFYLAYDPLIRQFQGTQKNNRIRQLHEVNPEVAAAWTDYESRTKALAGTLLDGGIYAHQTAVVEEEVEGDDGEMVIKKKTTGGDPDCFKFFLERAWQLVGNHRVVGMVMSSSLHIAHGATGLRRLLLNECNLRVLVKFDNERRPFPGAHHALKFDIVVAVKGGQTEAVDAAFFSRETERALQEFRSHRAFLSVPAVEIRKLSPQTLTLFEFRGQGDVELVQKAYRLHPTFGEGLMPKVGLKYRCEFHMGNMVHLFRAREWLRQHGCTQEPGEQWRAADTDWYRQRGYIERPIAQWYVLYQGDKVVDHKLPWKTKASQIELADLADFEVRFELPGGFRFFGMRPDDDGEPIVFVPPIECREHDLPAYIPAQRREKQVGGFTITGGIRPRERMLPLMEGKWVHHFNDRAYAYVWGDGSWVVTRPVPNGITDVISHYFVAAIDARQRTPACDLKIMCRDVSSATNERTMIATRVRSQLPCSDAAPTLYSSECDSDTLLRLVAWFDSFAYDYVFRMAGGRVKLFTLRARPTPCEELIESKQLGDLISQFGDTMRSPDEAARACLDSVFAEMLELTPSEFAFVLSTFPHLDRDQPPLPHDYQLRATNKGIERRKISFITRDLALLTYFDYLAGRLDVKPDPERVKRICPDVVPEPPEDIVEFFRAAGVDIGDATEHAVAATGPYRNLRERVELAYELGAVAYVPSIDRSKAPFVEEAAAAGGLSPDEGVLTPEMAQQVLAAKATREAKWARAMELWDQTPDPGAVPDDAQRDLATQR